MCQMLDYKLKMTWSAFRTVVKFEEALMYEVYNNDRYHRLGYFPFGFEGRMWDVIVSVPDHCLSFLLWIPFDAYFHYKPT